MWTEKMIRALLGSQGGEGMWEDYMLLSFAECGTKEEDMSLMLCGIKIAG